MHTKQRWSFKHTGKAALGFAILAMAGMSGQAQAQTGLSIDSGEITYADHVAQIITDNCVVCHRKVSSARCNSPTSNRFVLGRP